MPSTRPTSRHGSAVRTYDEVGRVYVASATATTNECPSASAPAGPRYDRILRHRDVTDRQPLPVSGGRGACAAAALLSLKSNKRVKK